MPRASFSVLWEINMPEIVKLLFKESLVTVQLDSDEELSLPYDVYIQYKLASGLRIEGDLYAELFEESRKTECRNKAFNFLAVRSRSFDEMEKYLKKKNFSEGQVSETINFLKEKGYLDDYEFSKAMVTGKMKGGRCGTDVIVRDLYRKGISRRIIDRVIRECGADITDDEQLYALAVKKYNLVKDKENALAKVGNYLRQKGFGYDSIKKVLRRLGNDEME